MSIASMRVLSCVTAFCGVALLGSVGCQRAHGAGDAVPYARGSIAIDGEWEEPDWVQVAHRHPFRGSDEQLARPSSEVRFLRDDGHVLVALYAADENIQTTDAFQLSIGALALTLDARGQVSPALDARGQVSPALADVRAAVGYDEGTIDDPHDDDEEWVVEVSIPLDLVGHGHVPVRASRCDTPKDGIQRCGSWAGAVSLE